MRPHKPCARWNPRLFLLAVACCAIAGPALAFDAFITMQDGYFFDSATGKPWVPHGIAYQTWNRPLGVWQTFDQIDYDLDEFVKMGANSVRIDMVWKHIEEDADNQFKWENYDYFVDACEKRGLRIFALIGYQWPPDWFPDEWYTQHPPEYDSGGIYHSTRWQSDIINYEHPDARAQYAAWINAVCARYKDSKAIVGWIVGNEYGYLGLWSGLLDGYDPESEAAFRTWCSNKYSNISNVNDLWGTSYSGFDDICFVEQYRAYGVEGAIWADMVQFREDSIADFTALSASAAKGADTNHLISYSTVGMQWGEEDWRYHAEDRGKITAAAEDIGASIDFFSVNNYPWSILGHESQQGHWGITYTKKVAKVPVLYSETGFTSSETMWPGLTELRQGPLIRNSLWESLQVGAIGTHIFTWQDRPFITDREKGFGIVYADRVIKPAYWTSRDVFTLMRQIGISDRLSGSTDPKPNIAFLWTDANDSQYNRYECEMQQLAGALERLGYEPNFMDLNELAAGGYTNYRVVILPRNMRVEREVPGSGGKGVLEFLRTVVIPAGVHVLASADLPGMQDPNGLAMTNFLDQVEALFGIDATDIGGYEVPQRTHEYVSWYWAPIDVRFNTNAAGPLTNGYVYRPYTWKYSDEIRVTNGGVLWAEMDSRRNKGFEMGPYSSTNIPEWDGVWGNVAPHDDWGWALDGTNMLQLWGDSGLWQDFPVVPFGRYTASTYLRSNTNDPLSGGACASISIEWLDEDGESLGTNISALLTDATPDEDWVRYEVEAIAPSNAWTGRRLIRVGPSTNTANLLSNGGLSGSGAEPTGWTSWNDGNADPDAGTYRTATPSWAFWWDSGIWQEVTSGFEVGDSIKFGGYLYTPSWDTLRGGDKHGIIQVEVYSNADVMATWSAAPTISSNSASNTWVYTEGTGAVPAGATALRLLVRCNGSAGDGRFLADDIFLARTTARGSVYVDHKQWSPAMVVKDHGTAKAAIFLYSVGDNKPDGDEDSQPDPLPWKWRYEILGSVVSNYFGVQPPLRASGTNAYLCLADYRTCADGSILMQVKNYLYDTNQPNGGSPQTFTITGDMLAGKTLRAFEQARILETNCNGTFFITLAPDGQEMIHAYDPPTNQTIVQIVNTPSILHPFGDQCYGLTVRYDTVGDSGLTLMIAFMHAGSDGEWITNKMYQVLSTNAVSGPGEHTFWMWIPDPDMNDPDYMSTPEGGDYVFRAWLEDASSNVVAETETQPTRLLWGITPTEVMPTEISKGDTTNIVVKWEDLHEQLYWQNTPLSRQSAYPQRIAVFRSTKTQAVYPDHFDRVNAVCDWLEAHGYVSANEQDIRFDNVWVMPVGGDGPEEAVLVFADDMESGTNGWTADGLWHQAETYSSSPTTSWIYNDGSDYDTGGRNYGSLVTPWMTLSNAEAGASLSFRSRHDTEVPGTTWDRKVVYITTNGTQWTELLRVSGSNGIWKTYSADLAAWAGSAVRIRFFFDTADAMYNQFEGWMVDDVEVATRSGARRDVFEDDMTDTTNWVSGGLWRLTTDRSASGPQSWVYNDGDDYSTGARSQGSILSPWLDLSRASSAQLSFKSWYETEDEGTTWDRKQVLASTNGTAWTRIHLVSGPSEEWTTEQVDLSAYAGGQVRLRFHFDSVDGQNNGFEGWYVDDVQVTAPEGLGAQVFSEGAEESTNTLTMSGLWHQASDLASAGSYSWAYNDGTDFDTGGPNSGELVTRWIDLMAGSGAALQFKSWYETEDSGTAWDRKLVYITTNGEDWVQLRQVTGPMRAWTAQTVDLSPYAGGRIRLKFLFDSVDGTHNQYRGWYLDEITVRLVGRDFAFFESFEDPAAYATNWTREAGAGNWDLSHDTLRAWRIGNDDNIVGGGDGSWSNYIVSADIRYDRQGPYFSDAELYVRYQDRNNYVKVGIRNFYEFWRLKYTVRVDTNFVEQGWIHSFSKTNRPIEGAWYNLKVRAETNTFTVYFDGENVGSFSTAHFPAGRIAVGSQAAQLGIWEPQRGYYFIDDDEYAFWSANEGEIVTLGTPLNLDWGYLKTFFPMLILPGTYVMSDTEVANVCAWITNGFFSLMATDGGVAKLDENGDPDPGRIESVFGVDSTMHALEGLGYAEIGTNIHYTTLDYAPEQVVELDGSANAWSKLGQGLNLATMHAGSTSAPAFICNVLTQRMDSPPKVFCFNYAVDTGGQLTNESRWVAQRALEWLQSQTYMLQLELKYVLVPTNPNLDIVVFSTNFWTLNGWGTNDITVNIPMDNCMTGTNLYWVLFTYPWDATNAWMTHRGFYSAANDGIFTTLDGIGLQLLGITDVAYAGRDWDMWVAYNTQGSNLLAHFGLKKRGQLRQEDNFNDGAADGWTITTNANIEWAATNSAVRATVVGAGGYAWIARDGLSITGQNITVEYDVRFAGGATNAGDGGVVFRGVPLGVTPGAAGWRAGVTNLYTNNLPVTGVWHHVMLSVRDGDPWLRSDLLVDGKVVFLNEPIESTNWGAPVLALLSPYHGGCVEWDNFRVADEEYSLTTQSVSGVFSPMEEGNFWGSLPDYDPDKWEFDGTALGGRYEWYIYFKGEGVNAYKRGGVFFAPRLMVEDEDFPADFYAGDTVFVPVEWENLGTNELPAYLTLNLQNPYADQMYTTNTFLVTNGWGSMLCEVAVPEDMPSAGDYQWSAYLYPTGAANGWLERIGSDDTFRFSPQGTPVGPETVIWVRAATGEQFAGYSDLGIPEPENMAYFTWSGAHDGDYTGIAVPEGDKCWKADVTGTYAGWGVFHTNGLKDLSGFNYLKFWVKTEERSLKIQIEAPQSVQWTLYLDQMGWDAANAGLWQEITVPITNFGFATPPTNVYGSFLATLEFLPSLRYSLRSLDNSTTWVVGDGGGTTHGLNIKCTTNGGARWAGVPATNFALTTWYNVDFVDANRGWAVGGLNIIAGTTNAGQSWTLLTNGLPFNNYWYALEFINSQTGWACGSTSIVMTTDGGATWTNQFGASNIVRAIRFSDEKKGWACGNNLLLTTTNGGTTWTYSPVPTPGVYWRDLFFVNSSTGWACGYSGLVCRTTDSGNTWELAAGVPALTNQYLYAMTWASESNGWMVGSGVDTNNMYFTRDGGASWSNANSGLSATLLDVEFSDANHGFAVGQSAYIMATTNGAAATPTWTHALPNARTFYIDNTRWTVNP